ncbi:MAG: HU family DNA-binding protein [Emticicia sp.]
MTKKSCFSTKKQKKHQNCTIKFDILLILHHKKMTKAELNQEINNRIRVNSVEIITITEALFEVIKNEIANGKKITFKGFGTFKTKRRAAKKVQLIKQKQTVDLAEHFIPVFLPSKYFLSK